MTSSIKHSLKSLRQHVSIGAFVLLFAAVVYIIAFIISGSEVQAAGVNWSTGVPGQASTGRSGGTGGNGGNGGSSGSDDYKCTGDTNSNNGSGGAAGTGTGAGAGGNGGWQGGHNDDCDGGHPAGGTGGAGGYGARIGGWGYNAGHGTADNIQWPTNGGNGGNGNRHPGNGSGGGGAGGGGGGGGYGADITPAISYPSTNSTSLQDVLVYAGKGGNGGSGNSPGNGGSGGGNGSGDHAGRGGGGGGGGGGGAGGLGQKGTSTNATLSSTASVAINSVYIESGTNGTAGAQNNAGGSSRGSGGAGGGGSGYQSGGQGSGGSGGVPGIGGDVYLTAKGNYKPQDKAIVFRAKKRDGACGMTIEQITLGTKVGESVTIIVDGICPITINKVSLSNSASFDVQSANGGTVKVNYMYIDNSSSSNVTNATGGLTVVTTANAYNNDSNRIVRPNVTMKSPIPGVLDQDPLNMKNRGFFADKGNNLKFVTTRLVRTAQSPTGVVILADVTVPTAPVKYCFQISGRVASGSTTNYGYGWIDSSGTTFTIPLTAFGKYNDVSNTCAMPASTTTKPTEVSMASTGPLTQDGHLPYSHSYTVAIYNQMDEINAPSENKNPQTCSLRTDITFGDYLMDRCINQLPVQKFTVTDPVVESVVASKNTATGASERGEYVANIGQEVTIQATITTQGPAWPETPSGPGNEDTTNPWNSIEWSVIGSKGNSSAEHVVNYENTRAGNALASDSPKNVIGNDSLTGLPDSTIPANAGVSYGELGKPKYGISMNTTSTACEGAVGLSPARTASTFNWYGCSQKSQETVTNTIKIDKGERSSVLFVLMRSKYDPTVFAFAVIQVGGRVNSSVDILRDEYSTNRSFDCENLRPSSDPIPEHCLMIAGQEKRASEVSAVIDIPKGELPEINWRISGGVDTVLMAPNNPDNFDPLNQEAVSRWDDDPDKSDCVKVGYIVDSEGNEIDADNTIRNLEWTQYLCTVYIITGDREISPVMTISGMSSFDSAASDMAMVSVVGVGTIAYNVNPSPVTMQVGGTQAFTGTIKPGMEYMIGGDARNVRWYIVGNNSSDTYIEETDRDELGNIKGSLHVGANETATALMVVVQSIIDSEFIGFAQVTIQGQNNTSVRIREKELTVDPDSCQTISAEVYVPAGSGKDLIWTVQGGTDSEIHVKSQPNHTGELCVGASETDRSLFITATAESNHKAVDYAVVNVNTGGGIYDTHLTVSPNDELVDLTDGGENPAQDHWVDDITPTLRTPTTDPSGPPSQFIQWEIFDGVSATEFEQNTTNSYVPTDSKLIPCSAEYTKDDRPNIKISGNESATRVYVKATACFLINDATISPVFDIATITIASQINSGVSLIPEIPDDPILDPDTGEAITDEAATTINMALNANRAQVFDGQLWLPDFINRLGGTAIQMKYSLIGSSVGDCIILGNSVSGTTKACTDATTSSSTQAELIVDNNNDLQNVVVQVTDTETANVIFLEACSVYDEIICARVRINITNKTGSSGLQVNPRSAQIYLKNSPFWDGVSNFWNEADPTQRQLTIQPKLSVPFGKTLDEIIGQGVTWEILIADEGTTLVTSTGVDCLTASVVDLITTAHDALLPCTLTIDSGESLPTVIVKVTANYDPTIFDITTVYVSGQSTSGIKFNLDAFDDIQKGNIVINDNSTVTTPPCDGASQLIGYDLCGNSDSTLNTGANLVLKAGLSYVFPVEINLPHNITTRDLTWTLVGATSKDGGSQNQTNLTDQCYGENNVLGSCTTSSTATSNHGFITLNIDQNEAADTLLLRSCLTSDSTKCDEVVVTVNGHVDSGVTIDPAVAEVSAGSSITLNATTFVPVGTGSDIIWELLGATGSSRIHDPSDENKPCNPRFNDMNYELGPDDERNVATHDCTLDVSVDETNFLLFVSARLAQNPTHYFTTAIYVQSRASSSITSYPVALTMRPGTDQEFGSHTSINLSDSTDLEQVEYLQNQARWELKGQDTGTYLFHYEDVLNPEDESDPLAVPQSESHGVESALNPNDIGAQPEERTGEQIVLGCERTSKCYVHVSSTQPDSTLYLTVHSLLTSSRKSISVITVHGALNSGLAACSQKFLDENSASYGGEPGDDDLPEVGDIMYNNSCPKIEQGDAGETVRFKSYVSNMISEKDKRVTCEIYGNSKGTTISREEDLEGYYDEDGNPEQTDSPYSFCDVYIDEAEIANELYVIVRSVADPQRFDKLTLSINARTTNGIIVTPHTIDLDAGQSFQFDANVTVPLGENPGVNWSIKGGSDTTYIGSDGTLHISPEETAKFIIVIGEMMWDHNRIDISTVGVNGKTTSGIHIYPFEPTVSVDSGLLMSAKTVLPNDYCENKREEYDENDEPVYTTGTSNNESGLNKDGEPEYRDRNYARLLICEHPDDLYKSVTWSMLGASSDQTYIDAESGMLTIAANEQANDIVVIARSKFDSSIKAMNRVTIVDQVKADVKIKEKSITVGFGKDGQLEAEVTVPKGEDDSVTWSLEGEYAAGTSINAATGHVNVAVDEKKTLVLVRAVSNFDRMKDDHAVVFVEKPPYFDEDINGIIDRLKKEQEDQINALQKLYDSLMGINSFSDPIYLKNSNSTFTFMAAKDANDQFSGVELDGDTLDSASYKLRAVSSDYVVQNDILTQTANAAEFSYAEDGSDQKQYYLLDVNNSKLDDLETKGHTLTVKIDSAKKDAYLSANSTVTVDKDINFRVIDSSSQFAIYLFILLALAVIGLVVFKVVKSKKDKKALEGGTNEPTE